MDSKDLSMFDCSTSSGSSDMEAQQLVMRGNQIDELEKKMRLNELNYKKRIIELENEMRNEQRRAAELQDELMKNIKEQGDYELIKHMNQGLQDKLTEHENQILEQAHKEHSLNQQIRNLKDSFQQHLQSQQQSMKNQGNPLQSPHSSTQNIGSSSNSLKKGAILVVGQTNSPSQHSGTTVKGFEATSDNSVPEDSENDDSLASIDKKDLIRGILDLKQEKEALECEIGKIREGAIYAIVEKERIIIELREQLESISQQRGFFNADCNDDDDGKTALLLKVEELKQENEEFEVLHKGVVENYERMLGELQGRLESESSRFEERMLSMESEMNERVQTNFQLNLDSAKDVEKDLLQQLQETEGRLRLVERSFADQAKVIAHLKESQTLQADEHAELKVQVALSKSFKERIAVLEREMVSAEKAAKKEVETKNEMVEKLTRRVNELLKNCVSFETESKRSLEALEAANESIDRCQNDITSLQNKLDEANTNYDQEISQLKKKFLREKKAWEAQAAAAAAGAAGEQKDENKKRISNEFSDVKNYENRQSCLKSDIGSADFDSCFDSPDVASRKRINNNKQLASASNSSSCRLPAGGTVPGTANEVVVVGVQNFDSMPTEVLSTWSAASSSGQYIEIHETPHQQSQLQGRDTIYSQDSCLPLREITQSVQSAKNYLSSGGASGSYAGVSAAAAGGVSAVGTSKFNAINIHALNSSVPQSKQRNVLFASKEQLASQASKQEMDWLRTMNEKLSYASESYEAEIDSLSTELRAAYKSMQDYRRGLAEHIMASKERESALKCELESLKTHVYKIETHMITYKLQYEEDNSYLKEELRIAERIAEENKIKVSSLAQDKDYFQAKYKSVLAQYKSKKSKEASSHSYLRPDEQNRADINLLRNSAASHLNPRPLLSSNHIWAFEDRR